MEEMNPETRKSIEDLMHQIAERVKETLPEDVKKDLDRMSHIAHKINKAMLDCKAIDPSKVREFNDLCFKQFSYKQDPVPAAGESGIKIIPKKGLQPEAGTWGDWKVEDIVRNYIRDHLDKSDGEAPDFDVYIVWKCKTLQHWKYLLASTLPDGMYYEMTFNGDKKEWYLDAYRKVENKVIPGVKE